MKITPKVLSTALSYPIALKANTDLLMVHLTKLVSSLVKIFLLATKASIELPPMQTARNYPHASRDGTEHFQIKSTARLFLHVRKKILADRLLVKLL